MMNKHNLKVGNPQPSKNVKTQSWKRGNPLLIKKEFYNIQQY